MILDLDLAEIYGVTTKRLNEQVKRNGKRFPADFMFRLTQTEWDDLKSQIATSNLAMRSQIATASKRNVRFFPYVFTEHGALMAANILNSSSAVEMSVFVVRAFIKMREAFAANKALALKLTELEKKLTSRLDIHEKAIVHVLGEIKKLMAADCKQADSQKRQIGFTAKEHRAGYAVKER